MFIIVKKKISFFPSIATAIFNRLRNCFNKGP